MISSKRLERGNWNDGPAQRLVLDLCTDMQNPEEVWYPVTKNLKKKTCPYKANVSWVWIGFLHSFSNYRPLKSSSWHQWQVLFWTFLRISRDNGGSRSTWHSMNCPVWKKNESVSKSASKSWSSDAANWKCGCTTVSSIKHRTRKQIWFGFFNKQCRKKTVSI